MNGLRTAIQTPQASFHTTKIRPATVAIGNTRRVSTKKEESKVTPLLPPYFVNCSKTSPYLLGNENWSNSIGFIGEDNLKRQQIFSCFETIYKFCFS